MRNPLLAPDLRELVVERDEEALREFFTSHHPAEAAELLDDLLPAEVIFVLRLLDRRHAAAVFSYLEVDLQEGIAESIERRELADLLTYMSHDERADLVTRLSPGRVEQIWPLMAHAEREDIRRLMSYKDGTAGAVMTSDYATLPPELSAAAAIERLRKVAPDRETIYYSYVIDNDRRLLGLVSLKDLILAPPNRRVSEIMQPEVISARIDDDQEKVARLLAEYDLLALPIVDAEDRMMGIVTHDDVLDVIVEEATEDVHRLGGVAPLEEDYLRTPFLTLWTKRSMWLAILFFGGFMTTAALAGFQETFEKVPALVWFVPLIVSAGGNCGSQSATLITRALALGQLTPADWFRVLWHEILMGASLGLALGAFGFVRAWFVPDEALAQTGLMSFAGVVALGVLVVVLCGNLVGALLPLLLKRVGLDPALMSNPLLASLVDVTGILAYFAIASWLLL